MEQKTSHSPKELLISAILIVLGFLVSMGSIVVGGVIFLGLFLYIWSLKPKDAHLPKEQQETKNKNRIIISLFIVLFFFVGLWINSQMKDDPVQNTGNVPNTAQVPKTEGIPEVKTDNVANPPLEVQSWNWNESYGYVFAQGEVKNLTSEPMKNVMIVVNFYTKDGTFVSSEEALIGYTTLLPGQISPFKAGGTSNPEIKKATISFKEFMGKEIPYKEKDGQDKK